MSNNSLNIIQVNEANHGQSYSNQRSLGLDESFVSSVETYIEGPIKQIEAARKALHSPSLNARKSFDRSGSHSSDMRKYSENVQAGGQKAARKCLSRAQMAEPYELSQDLLDKQMEVLGNKYGGGNVANSAANTIQRAYRRYTMERKFKAITSAVNGKAENRLSRRFASMAGSGVPLSDSDLPVSMTSPSISVPINSSVSGLERINSIEQPVDCCGHNNVGMTPCSGPTRVNVYNSPPDTVRSSSSTVPARSSLEQYHQQLQHQQELQLQQHQHQKLQQHLQYQQQLQLQQQQLQQLQHMQQHHQHHHDTSPNSRLNVCGPNHTHSPPPSGGGGGGIGVPHHDCHTTSCPSRGRYGLHAPHHHIGVRPGPSFDDEENSDADIQSFPVDYLPDRSALTCVNRVAASRQLSTGRMVGPSHAHCANCGSGQALPSHHSHRVSNSRKKGPDVPKRTVSRLTSLDVGESSELYPARSQPHSRTSSTQSSPRIGVLDPGGGVGVPPKLDPKLSGSSIEAGHFKPEARAQRDLNRNIRAAAGSDRSTVDSALQNNIPNRSKEGYHGNYAVNEVIRKRHYRTGLNIFNKKPEKGISYLISKGFLDNSPAAVARFLLTRKGLSKQMIGEYLGNISTPFNQAVLTNFASEVDLSGTQVDLALRKFQTYFRMPGEAQKIERLMEVFSHRYCVCNPGIASKLNSADTIFILAFAIILLNTDLHTPSLKPEKRMKVEDFVRNLRGIDGGADVDRDTLEGIYERISKDPFKPGSDHVTQVMKVQQTIVVKCPNLAVPYRRLVCYCRLYEVTDKNKKDRPGQHQREVFLFNDILVITKIHSRRKNSVTYTFRNSFPLTGMLVSLFENSYYSHGISLTQRWDRKVVITLNARNDHDRSKFVEDLRESIAEMDEMESLRIEAELEKQHVTARVSTSAGHDNTRDSGVNDCDPNDANNRARYGSAESSVNLKRSAINNSLLDLAENHNLLAYPGYNNHDKPVRRGSVGSLDSGMSVSFQSGSAGSAGTVSQESSPQQQQTNNKAVIHPRPRNLSANMSTNL